MKTAGIDIGTTSISDVITEGSDNHLLGSRTVTHNASLHAEKAYHRLQDPEKLFRLACDALCDLIRVHGTPQAIGLTGQMHGILYVDAAGQAVSPLYTWQDDCGSQPLTNTNGNSSASLLRDAGLPASSGYGLATHLFLQHTHSVPANAVSFVSIADFVAMRLTACTEAFAAPDLAASFGGLDVKTGSWMINALEHSSVDTSYLPKLHLKHDIIGLTTGCIDGIPEGIPVLCSLGDHQASVFGSTDCPEGSLLLNIGTGSQVSMPVNQYIDASSPLEIRPFLSGSYLLTGAALCGGRAYAMLEQFYRSITRNETSLYAWMEENAAAFLKEHKKEEAWQIETAFAGKRNDPSASGNMCGITTENFTPGAMTVGMICGILNELHEMYEKMCTLTGKTAVCLIGSGNGLRQNRVMQQLTEEIFHLPLQISEAKEEAACGAAKLAGKMLQS
ncbi:MAG: FGGY family carbohydrate kinase [Lachnospiraceae bacterium]|nr:FGGY family carbohydrate kinase [Lachnospiraceae bacterium]